MGRIRFTPGKTIIVVLLIAVGTLVVMLLTRGPISVQFGIDQAEIFRLSFLIIIVVILLLSLLHQVYRDRSTRMAMVQSLQHETLKLQQQAETLAERLSVATLRRAESIADEVKAETAQNVQGLQERMDQLATRFDQTIGPVVPVIKDTHRIVDQRLEKPAQQQKQEDGSNARETDDAKTTSRH